jgi:hypothetical protein
VPWQSLRMPCRPEMIPQSRDDFAARHTCSSCQTVSKPSPPKCRPLDNSGGLRRYPRVGKGFRRVSGAVPRRTGRDALGPFAAGFGWFSVSLAGESLIRRTHPK